jgi:hemolysin III
MAEHRSRRHEPKVLVLRDPASGFLHFVGALLSVAALVLLVCRAALEGTAWHVVSYAIFGSGMILLYVASTACHWFQPPDKPAHWLEKLDHVMIYVLIAATYTPVCLVVLRGPWGWSIFGAVWGLAVLGAVLKFVRFRMPVWLNAGLYVALGWVAAVAAVPLARALPTSALVWMLIGGACYTVGAVVFALRWPRIVKDVFSHHEIFHILVLGGSFCFFWTMYAHVIAIGS